MLKWVLQVKKLAAQKIYLVTLSFHGGDFRPLTKKLALTNYTVLYRSATIDLSTSVSGEVDMTSGDHSI